MKDWGLIEKIGAVLGVVLLLGFIVINVQASILQKSFASTASPVYLTVNTRTNSINITTTLEDTGSSPKSASVPRETAVLLDMVVQEAKSRFGVNNPTILQLTSVVNAAVLEIEKKINSLPLEGTSSISPTPESRKGDDLEKPASNGSVIDSPTLELNQENNPDRPASTLKDFFSRLFSSLEGVDNAVTGVGNIADDQRSDETADVSVDVQKPVTKSLWSNIWGSFNNFLNNLFNFSTVEASTADEELLKRLKEKIEDSNLDIFSSDSAWEQYHELRTTFNLLNDMMGEMKNMAASLLSALGGGDCKVSTSLSMTNAQLKNIKGGAYNGDTYFGYSVAVVCSCTATMCDGSTCPGSRYGWFDLEPADDLPILDQVRQKSGALDTECSANEKACVLAAQKVCNARFRELNGLPAVGSATGGGAGGGVN